MIRKFCDLCDNEMQDDDRVFTVGVMETTPEDNYSRKKDVRLATGEYVSLTQHHGMVCIDCATGVVKVIHEKKKHV